MNKVFNLICCGSVDDGKSTLIGRILFDTNNVKKDQLEDALRASRRNGSKELEYSMLLDGLLSEREQQITIDIAHRFFDYEDVRFHILDCPGHEQYTKNMAIAAACADAAILVIDVTKGISPQTLRHLEICKLLNVKKVCCCLTKIDLLDDVTDRNNQIDKISMELKDLSNGFPYFDVIPVSATAGINIDKVINKIVEYSNKIIPTIEHKIMYVHAVRLYKGERYFYVSPVCDVEPKVGEHYFVYSGYGKPNICVTVSKVIGYGCFQIKEDIDVQRGDVLSQKYLISSDTMFHSTIWFDEPTSDMLIKQGTRIAKIISIDDKVVKTDRPLFINNVCEYKYNALAIIIDNITKKTLACVVFNNNVYNIEEHNKNILNSDRKKIVFDEQIISLVGLDNIMKVSEYLKKSGFEVQLDIKE